MTKNLASSFFRAMGYEIRKIRSGETSHPSRPEFRARSPETTELKGNLDAFFADVNAPESTNKSWAGYDSSEMLSYLTDERLSFYHSIVDLCTAEGLLSPDVAVADVGTYLGYLPRLILRRWPAVRVTGFDVDARSLQLARFLCPATEFLAFDVLRCYDDHAGRFDLVLCTEVLEHLVEPEQSLVALLRLRKEGGALLLTVPNGRKDTSEAGDFCPDTGRYAGHIHFWSPESWRVFLSRNTGQPFDCGLMPSGDNYAIIRG